MALSSSTFKCLGILTLAVSLVRGFTLVATLDGLIHQRKAPPFRLPAVRKEDFFEDMVTLGNLKVPSVGTGTIAWSSEQLFKLENSDIDHLVQTALKANANTAFFDTAERYGSHLKAAIGLGWGETEKLLGSIIRRNAMDTDGSFSALVATKFTPVPWRTTVESVVEACDQSRRRLGVDQIDLYQLHMPDIVQPLKFMPAKPKDDIYWRGLVECYRLGLVKNVGVCNYGPTLLRRCQDVLARNGVPLASNQIPFSLIGRQNGAQETVDACHEAGVAVLAYYPFAMGLLTGKYHSHQHGKLEVSHSRSKSLSQSKKTFIEELELLRYARGDGTVIPLGGITPLLQELQYIAQKRDKTIAQVALNYIMCKGAIPIPGARTAAQVSENLGAMGWRLNEEEIVMLERAAETLGFGFEGAGFKRTSEKFVGYGIEKWSLD